jgi:hypothetical protein
LLLIFKALNNCAPIYIKYLIQPYVPARQLRSSNCGFSRLKPVIYNQKTYGYRAFSVTAPLLWNALPDSIKTSPNVDTFKSRTKTFLFKSAYNL